MSTDYDPVIVAEVLAVLNKAISDPSERNASDFIKWILINYVNANNLTQAIDLNLDVLTLALNHYAIGHSTITPLVKIVLNRNWESIEEVLTDARKVQEILSKDDECRKILASPRGIDYLNRCVRTTYVNLYKFVWENDKTLFSGKHE